MTAKKRKTTSRAALPVIGWREWVALPGLGIDRMKVKTDTGARSSALHAFYVEPFVQDGEDWVKFGIHPRQQRADPVVDCAAPVHDRRVVTDSGGHAEERYVILTQVRLAGHEWPAELTLTNRDTMRFRMLLGRTALNKRFIVDPAASFLLSDGGDGNGVDEGDEE